MGSRRIRRQLFWVATSLAGGIVVLSVLLAVLTAKYGSVAAGTAYMRGERLLILPRTLDVGTEREQAQTTHRLELLNLSDEKVSILGVKTSCSCIEIEDELPIEIPGRGSHFLTLKVHFTGQSDQFQQTIVVYSDVAQGTIASATITGRIGRTSQSH